MKRISDDYFYWAVLDENGKIINRHREFKRFVYIVKKLKNFGAPFTIRRIRERRTITEVSLEEISQSDFAKLADWGNERPNYRHGPDIRDADNEIKVMLKQWNASDAECPENEDAWMDKVTTSTHCRMAARGELRLAV